MVEMEEAAEVQEQVDMATKVQVQVQVQMQVEVEVQMEEKGYFMGGFVTWHFFRRVKQRWRWHHTP